MIEVDVCDLDGLALDWAIANAVRDKLDIERDKHGRIWLWRALEWPIGERELYSPTENPAQAGPIIDESGIASRRHSRSGTWYAMLSSDLGDTDQAGWQKYTIRGGERYGQYSYQVRKRQQRFMGSTRLIASMRAFVASRMGRVVRVPTDLV